jgi:TatD DNase family protein
MTLIDTHTHLYLEDYNDDRDEVIKNALNKRVELMLLPNIDSGSMDEMKKLTDRYPGHCLPMMGLHPTSVKEDYEKELKIVEEELDRSKYYGVGEIGIDLYWDKTFKEQQEDAFRRQLQLAKKYQLPVSIHTRDSFDTAYSIVKEELTDDLKGVFHCFTGTEKEARKIMDIGFFMGIGGIITFKNSGLGEVVKNIPLEHLVLETDAPFLTPVPYRGKRNQSAYLAYIAGKIAEVKNIMMEEVADATTSNALELFKLTLK